jgi:uncharacterized MAPEG superfamily protein
MVGYCIRDQVIEDGWLLQLAVHFICLLAPSYFVTYAVDIPLNRSIIWSGKLLIPFKEVIVVCFKAIYKRCI